MPENDPQPAAPLEPNLPQPPPPDPKEKPSAKLVYTDVTGEPLEGDALERAKEVSLVGRPHSKGDPENQKADEKPS